MIETDAELVARVQSGDAAAFDTLMRRYLRMAVIVAYAQLQNRADAEDVCQDAFVRCWERMRDCRDPERVSAWIAAIVRNTAHNRRIYFRLRQTEAIDDARNVAAPEGADARLAQRELRDRLEAALSRLTTTQREVVLLHDYEGWKHDEIASRLDISVLMSRRHLSDARRTLRELLRQLPVTGREHD